MVIASKAATAISKSQALIVPDANMLLEGAGKEAKLSFMGHPLIENRSGLVVATRLTQATGLAERAAASTLIEGVTGRHRIMVGADRAYDMSDFVAGLRRCNATPHVAQNLSGRSSRIDRRTVRHPGYLARQRARKRIEEAFGWIKTIAGQAKTRESLASAAPPGSAGPSPWRRRRTT